MATKNKIGANETGLRYAEEASFGVLPGSPVWKPFEPNSYADFGGQTTTTPRAPIDSSRQRKKGRTTDLDASGGFNTDLTYENLQDILQGFFYADLRTKAEFDENTVTNVVTATDDYELTALAVSAVVAAGGAGYAEDDVLTLSGGTFGSAATFTVTGETGGVVDTVEMTTPGDYTAIPADPVSTTGGGGAGCTLTVTWDTESQYFAGDLLWAKDFDDDENNGLKNVTAADENAVTVSENLVDDASPVGTILRVGFQFAAGDLDVDASGTLPKLTTTTKDLTELGLIPGEPIFIGGDTAITQFQNSENNGFKRVKSISANEIVIDKSNSAMVTEASTTETMRVWVGRVLKNETGTLIKRRTYQLERLLGAPDDASPSAIQAEYVEGAVPSEAVTTVARQDLVKSDLSFIGKTMTYIDAATALKSGSRPAQVEADAFAAPSDVKRAALAKVVPGDEAPTPLFAFVREWTLTINNGLTAEKAAGTLGSFDVTDGSFAVSAAITAYFQNVGAQEAIQANDDVTFDWHMVYSNQGISYDLPLVTLGDGRPTVERDQAVTLPLAMDAATAAKIDSNYDHTLLVVFWDYLPDLADT